MTRRFAHLCFAALAWTSTIPPLIAQKSSADGGSRRVLVVFSDSALITLGAVDKQVAAAIARTGQTTLEDELIRNVCELYVGSGAEHPSRIVRTKVWMTTDPADSIPRVQRGARCINGRGDSVFSTLDFTVIRARVDPTFNDG